jgi:hypothetical protein
MSGIFGGSKKKTPVAQPKAEVPQQASQATAITGDEGQAAARRARRGGRGLLSESRLNPEQGVATLGQSGML